MSFASVIWMVCGQREDALRTAKDTLKLIHRLGNPYRDSYSLNGTSGWPPQTLFPPPTANSFQPQLILGSAAYVLVCQVFANLGDYQNYKVCIDMLQEISPSNPVASNAIRLLENVWMQHSLMAQQSCAKVFQILKVAYIQDLEEQVQEQPIKDDVLENVAATFPRPHLEDAPASNPLSQSSFLQPHFQIEDFSALEPFPSADLLFDERL
jgi:hypothetical protein